jgi:hypothetical protein
MNTQVTTHNKPRWNLDDIDFDSVDVSLARDDEFLFTTLASASFVEILAQTYSDNLIRHFSGHNEVTDWLDGYWQHEEVQHGNALKSYVRKVWPEFDWEKAHGAFRSEYGLLCTVEQLEPDLALELVARCVIETGTSTFYRALRSYAQEPVLRRILDNISADETAHYAHFRRYFESCDADRPKGTGAVVSTIWRRVHEIRSEDAYIAYRHVYAGRHPGRPVLEADWSGYSRQVRRLAREHYPYLMAVRMLMKPVPVIKPVKQVLQWPLAGLAYMLSG